MSTQAGPGLAASLRGPFCFPACSRIDFASFNSVLLSADVRKADIRCLEGELAGSRVPGGARGQGACAASRDWPRPLRPLACFQLCHSVTRLKPSFQILPHDETDVCG